jgi:tRNA A-37 threonylcarbamoyl transferase component Bud32
MSRKDPPRPANREPYVPPSSRAEELEERLREALTPNLLVIREIGAGGMARVFLAREPALKRLVAVKVLAHELADTDAGRARFEREAQAVAALSHPNIVAVHAVGELADGTPYFIMQYVEGRSVSERVEREGPLEVVEARRMLGEVAAALAAAHRQGIIHRDVKPANILYEDATGRCLVSDFGIAAVEHQSTAVNTKLTATGVIIGTPQYMSPEQLLAEPVSEKTDIYGLGLLAHEMLCGSGPFRASSPHELIAAHLRDVPARLAVRRPEVDPELDAVIARCLEKNAADRPSADEVARRLAPGAGALLEWPPPGLEQLHGRLRRLGLNYLLGGVFIALTMVTIIAAGPRMNSLLASPVTLLILIVAMAGAVLLSVAVARTIAVGSRGTQAVESGYSWMTVFEVLADTRGDTGNVIAASREYAGLAPGARDRYRRNRIWSETALFAGGALVVPTFLLVVMLGSNGIGGWRAAWLVLGVPIAGVLVTLALSWWERRAFAAHRRRGKVVSRAEIARLAGPWYDTFESVRNGQRLARGRALAPSLGRRATIAGGTILAVMLLLLIPLNVVATLGPAYWTWTLPKFANTKDRIRISQIARPYVLAKDPRITALDAGRAFYSLHAASRESSMFPEHDLPERLPPAPWDSAIPAGLFPTAQWTQAPNIPSPLAIITAARRGFTPAEMAYLARVASAAQWKPFDLMARARSIDYLGARYRLPFPQGANVWALPIPKFTATKTLAYASLSRAAYHLARGNRDSAQTVLRGTISVGFLLIDEGNTLIEQLIGAVITGIGRAGLIDYYNAIGDPRGAALQARLDSMVATVEEPVPESARLFQNVDAGEVAALRDVIRRTARDPRELRGVRLEMLHVLGMAPCTNLRELVFGPAPDVTETFAYARAKLARFPSDSAVLTLIERQPETIEMPLSENAKHRWVQSMAKVVGSGLGNRRLAGCVALLSMLSG